MGEAAVIRWNTTLERPRSMSIESHSNRACHDSCGYQRMVFWSLVSLQVLIAATIVLTLRPPIYEFAAFATLLCGLALGSWAIVSMGRPNLNILPEVRKGAVLVERGPYRYLRHPMYSALALCAGSFVLSEPAFYGVRLWLGLALTLIVKSLYEESFLRRRFPEYSEYMAKTARFIPFVV